jgi:hypothetical protein
VRLPLRFPWSYRGTESIAGAVDTVHLHAASTNLEMIGAGVTTLIAFIRRPWSYFNGGRGGWQIDEIGHLVSGLSEKDYGIG